MLQMLFGMSNCYSWSLIAFRGRGVEYREEAYIILSYNLIIIILKIIRGIGSHKRGSLEHGKCTQRGNALEDNQALELDFYDLKKTIQTNLVAGQATFPHGLLIHSSPLTRSPRTRRCGLTAQYLASEATFHPMSYNNTYEEDWRKPVLVAGEDTYETIKYLTTMENLHSTFNGKSLIYFICLFKYYDEQGKRCKYRIKSTTSAHLIRGLYFNIFCTCNILNCIYYIRTGCLNAK